MKKTLKQSHETIDWLLEENNYSVRYFTLVDLLDRKETDPEVIEAKNEIMTSKTVKKIFSKQNENSHWEAKEKFYTAKYKGTVWQLIVLAELGVSKDDERIKNACEFIIEHSQDVESGGFSYQSRKKKEGGIHSGVIPCLTGNMLWSLIKFGYLDDPRVKEGINWVTTYQRFDDSIEKAPKGWPYDQWENCWGKHTCHMGIVKVLKAFAEIPKKKRTKAVKETIDQGAEFMLKHHIYKKSHNLDKVSKPGWKKFGFPLMYQTDVLEVLGILTKLGYRDDRMNEAIELIQSKQDENGRWVLENTFNGRMQTTIEQKGKASKWITLNALRVLKELNLN